MLACGILHGIALFFAGAGAGGDWTKLLVPLLLVTAIVLALTLGAGLLKRCRSERS